MNDEVKEKKPQLLHVRSVAGCLTEGWRMMADNLWTLLRGSWPVVAVAAAFGLALGALVIPSMHVGGKWIALLAVAVCVGLTWTYSTALLVRKYHQLGYIPTTPALRLIRDDRGATVGRVLRLLGQLLVAVRQWGGLLGVLLVGGLFHLAVGLVGALPLLVLVGLDVQASVAMAMGDVLDTPAWLPALCLLFGVVASVVWNVASWLWLLPMAFHAGSFCQERIERMAEQAAQEA